MHQVEFYADSQGNEPVKDFLVELQAKRDSDKSARILSEKILTYIRVLQEYGTRAGMPYHSAPPFPQENPENSQKRN